MSFSEMVRILREENKEKETLNVVKEFEGKPNRTKKKNINCLLCKGIEKYIQYMLEIILKLPRTEKFSIGTEYKNSMYKTLNYVMYLNKIEGYNNIADFCYRKLKKNASVFINGRVENYMITQIKNIIII